MLKDKKIYANKFIQTRNVNGIPMKIGEILFLITDMGLDDDGINSKLKSEPYYYVGSTNDIGYFVLADIINEIGLTQCKRKIERTHQAIKENLQVQTKPCMHANN